MASSASVAPIQTGLANQKKMAFIPAVRRPQAIRVQM